MPNHEEFNSAQIEKPISPIESLWVVEKGRWDKTSNSFVDRYETEFERTIKMEIITEQDISLLRFIGGPTGWEIYNIEDLISLDKRDSFCICGGTINRYPRCHVNAKEVFLFIQKHKLLLLKKK